MSKRSLKTGELGDYTPFAIRNVWDSKEARKEYSRLRKIANKRMGALERSEFKESQIVKQNKGFFVPLKEIEDEREFAYRLSHLAYFIASDRSSVRGLQAERKKNIETLHAHGYTFVNKKNYKAFGEFMGDVKSIFEGMMYDSERVAEMFAESGSKKVALDKVKQDFIKYRKRMMVRESMAKRGRV